MAAVKDVVRVKPGDETIDAAPALGA